MRVLSLLCNFVIASDARDDHPDEVEIVWPSGACTDVGRPQPTVAISWSRARNSPLPPGPRAPS